MPTRYTFIIELFVYLGLLITLISDLVALHRDNIIKKEYLEKLREYRRSSTPKVIDGYIIDYKERNDE